MKHFILASLLFIQSSLTFSQFDITSSYNIEKGEYTIYGLDAEDIAEGGSGTAQTWDFSSQSILGSMVESYVDPATTPYTAQFPGATLASKGDEDVYSYYIINDSKFTHLGSVYSSDGWTDIIKYKKEEVLYSYPFNYGTTQFHSSIEESIEAHDNVVTRIERIYNYDTIMIDGSGTLVVPGGGSYSAIRLKGYGTSIDSIFTPELKFSEREIERYTTFRYYIKDVSYPAVIISEQIYGDGTSDKNAVFYKPTNTAIVKNDLIGDNLWSTYPNPASENISIRFSNEKMSNVIISLQNVAGVQVAELMNEELSIGDQILNFQLPPNISKGVYIIKITCEEQSSVKRIVLN